jgi:hypothetical protein
MSRNSAGSVAGSWGSAFAGAMLMVVGLFQFFQGLTAVVNGSQFFVTTPSFIFQLNTTTWGWIHLILGIIVAAAGLFIFTGNVVARGLGIFLAGLQAVVNFMWLPYYPVWGLVIIALDVFVIWSLATTRLSEKV